MYYRFLLKCSHIHILCNRGDTVVMNEWISTAQKTTRTCGFYFESDDRKLQRRSSTAVGPGREKEQLLLWFISKANKLSYSVAVCGKFCVLGFEL